MVDKTASHRKTSRKTVRRAERVSSQLAETARKVESPERSVSQDIVLYRDERVIEEMCHQLINVSNSRRNVVGTLLDKIQSILGRAEISLDDFDEENIDEFAIRPVIKLATGIEAGAEFEVKWSFGKRIDLTKAIPMMLSKLPKKSTSQLVLYAEKYN